MDRSRTILPLALKGVSFAAGGQTLVHDLSLEIAGGSRTIRSSSSSACCTVPHALSPRLRIAKPGPTASCSRSVNTSP